MLQAVSLSSKTSVSEENSKLRLDEETEFGENHALDGDSFRNTLKRSLSPDSFEHKKFNKGEKSLGILNGRCYNRQISNLVGPLTTDAHDNQFGSQQEQDDTYKCTEKEKSSLQTAICVCLLTVLGLLAFTFTVVTKPSNMDQFEVIDMEVKPLMTGSWGGFINSGVTCYVNSTLQLLLHIDPFFEWLKNSQFDAESVSSTVRELSKLHRSQRTVDPKPLLSWLNYISPKLRNDTQEDAHEFLDGLLKCFQAENQHLDKNIVECTFGSNLTVTITCEVCTYTSSERKELNVQYFSLLINKAGSVEDALQQYLHSSGMKSYCRYCKSDTSKRQDTSIDKSSPFLILHLKRFIMGENYGSSKLCRKIQINRAVNFNGKQFRLAAIVMHHGTSMNSGHYTALCRREEEWWHYNDHEAKMILMDEQTMKGLQSTAYLLLYEDLTVQTADKEVYTPGKRGTNRWVSSPLQPSVSPKETPSKQPIRSSERECSKPLGKVKRKLDMDSQQKHIGSDNKAGSELTTEVH
ncbi:uncharacterized protein LOC127750007 [Frankliniella occidentalis]|uniref:Uncharacterized protein LOC127750007 n=1 Tax=Frankliniella occidentalis TaxID=133901 RepID=A0A9C6UEB7_FRAOC|nr:uncharacterized protein LOC127750007 [Frankliniella occidentalis]